MQSAGVLGLVFVKMQRVLLELQTAWLPVHKHDEDAGDWYFCKPVDSSYPEHGP